MKKIIGIIFTLGFAVFFWTHYGFASQIEADSHISQVTAYPDSALITRQASLKLDLGDYTIVLSNIIPELDENSLRVSKSGTAEVTILGAKVEKEFLEEVPAERVRQLREEIQKLEDDLQRFNDARNVLDEEKGFLDSIRLFAKDQLPEDLVTKMPTSKDLDETFKFLDTRLKDHYTQVMDVELKIRELQKKIDALRRELAQVSGPARKLKRAILVDLQVIKAGSLDINVSYLVWGASWRPIYDARANFEKSKVEMVSYGIITQKTGEDWQDVEVYLSTAKPAIGGRMPYVAPWFIRPYQPMKQKEIMMERKLSYQSVAFDKVGEAKAPEAPVYSEVQEKGIAVVYKLLNKAAIKSDGSEHKLPISSQILSAKFEYSSYPRAVVHAYLGSRVANAPTLQLLGGRVNIFLEGDFVGTSSIDTIGPGEEFDLYLGVDENVKVKREQIEKKVDETLIAGIPALTRRTTFKYKLTVENYKSKKINVKLFEAMPISEDERIKVKIEKISLEPKEKDWKDRKGVWLWELELEPKAKQEIFYTFVVEHSRDVQLEGL